MKCPNCQKEMKRLSKEGFYCSSCKEVFQRDDKGKFEVVKDKKAFVEGTMDKTKAAFKDWQKTIDEILPPEKKDDDEGFFFG